MENEAEGKMASNEGEKRSRRLKRSRRRLIGLLIVLLLGLVGVGLLAEGSHKDSQALRDKEDQIVKEALEAVQFEQSSNMDPKENEAKLQAVLYNTNAELQRTKAKLEKAAEAAQQKIADPPAESTRESVTSGLGNLRSALSRAHEKLTELNEPSTGKDKPQQEKQD